MLTQPDSPITSPGNAAQEVAALIERDPRLKEQKGPFEFWYRWTAPASQPLSASFELREQARQGRLTSTVLAAVAGSLTILAIPTSFATNNPILLVVLCVLLTITGISLFLNKLGHGTTGRWLITLAVNVSLWLSIITFVLKPGGLTTNILPVLDIVVVEPILMALVLLPSASAFILGVCNTVFIVAIFILSPKSLDLRQFMATDAYEIITRPLYLLIFVISVVYPVIRSSLRAIALGDRAKEIARVQHDLANREAQAAREKQQLDEGISQLVQALNEANRGNYRIHLSAAFPAALWPIAHALNALYARIRGLRQKEHEYQHTKNAATRLIQAIRLSKHNAQPLSLEQTGNPIIDSIALELSRKGPFTHSLDQEQHRNPRQNS